MPACHQCGAPAQAPRRGPCGICKAVEQSFCARCALWELGPLPAPAGLPPAFRAHEAPLVPVKECPLQRQAREEAVELLADDCALLTQQRASNATLYGTKTFNEALDDALALYDEVYAASGLDRAMMRALITAQISAHEVTLRHRRAQDAVVEGRETAIERWRTARNNENNTLRTLKGELEVARATVGARGAKTRVREEAKLTAERLLLRIETRELEVARLTRLIEEEQAKEHVIRLIHRHDAPKIAARHLRSCFAGQVPGGQEEVAGTAVASEVVEMVLRQKMPLGIARMMLRAEGGGDAAKAKKIFEISLALYHARSAQRPPDGTQDGGFDPRKAPGYMDAAHRTFLFGVAPASPPELTPEAKTLLGTLYASLDVEVANSPRFEDVDVQAALGDGEITAAQAQYLQSLPRMDHADPGDRSPCEAEVFARVIARLAPLLGLSTDEAALRLNAMIADMRASYDLATSSFDGLLDSYAAAPLTAAVESASVRASGVVQWTDVLPCDGVDGSFRGSRYDLTWHRQQKDGRQEAWHYFDWRNDKDRALYDFFPLEIAERPIFVSLSMAENLPEVDTRYGHHTVVWRRSLLRRAAFTIGDKGNPRRSMLLLIRDLLYPIPLKDGAPATAPTERVLTLGNIHERLVRRDARSAFGQLGFDQMLLGPKTQMSTGANIEAHVFGPVVINTHALGIILKDGTTRDRVRLAVPAPTWTEVRYGELPGDRVTRRPSLLEPDPAAKALVVTPP